MAGHDVLRGDFLAHRLLLGTAWHGIGTARVEAAARGWVEGAGDFAGEHDVFPLVIGMGWQGGGKQGLGVGMQRMGAEFLAVGQLDYLTQVHHGNAMADVGDGGQVMANEEITHPQGLLQMFELVDNLGADRDVQRRHRLVEHHAGGCWSPGRGQWQYAGAAHR